MQPRVIRLRDATVYSGMDINRFNKEIRPYLSKEFSVGVQGVGFDRVELDAVLELYMKRNERPKEKKQLWDVKEHQASISGVVSGTSIKSSTKGAFAKVLAQVTSRKQNVT